MRVFYLKPFFSQLRRRNTHIKIFGRSEILTLIIVKNSMEIINVGENILFEYDNEDLHVI